MSTPDPSPNLIGSNPFRNRTANSETEPEKAVEVPAAIVKQDREPIQIGANGLELRNSDQVIRLASLVFKAKLVPNSFRTPEQVVIALFRALELGIRPLQALEGMSVINGRVGLMGDLALSLVEASGELADISKVYSGEGDDFTCVLTIQRKGRKPHEYSFSVGEAKQAGIYERSMVWKTYPKRLTYYRALGFALRDEFSDILKGCKTTEELADYPD